MRRDSSFCSLALLVVSGFFCASLPAADRLILEPPKAAKGHIVLVAGDEEYRSEEVMPMLAKILSQKHGFKCTVLFSMGPDGAQYIDANNQEGLRGLETLDTADLLIIATRFATRTQSRQHTLRPTSRLASPSSDFAQRRTPSVAVRNLVRL